MSNRISQAGGPSYTARFSESGLPPGTEWTIDLNGTVGSSTNTTINFYGLNAGTYAWTASFPNGSITGTRYLPNLQNGTINLPSQNSTSIAYSVQNYLNLRVSPSNEGTVSPSSGWYNSGSKVSISVQPSQGYVFSNWTGSGQGSYSGSTKSVIVTMNGPITETANLLQVFAVIFNEQGLPGGTSWTVTMNAHTQTITSSSVAFVVLGSGTYNWTVVSQIPGASGVQYAPVTAFGSIQLPKDAGQLGVVNVTIDYLTQYYVSILTSNSGGSITPKSGWFNAGTTLPIFASVGPGFNFTGWQVSNSSDSLPRTVSNSSTELIVTVDGPGTITALFSENPNHGRAISNNGGVLSPLTDNPAFADPIVQFATIATIIGIIIVAVFFLVKKWFTPKD